MFKGILDTRHCTLPLDMKLSTLSTIDRSVFVTDSFPGLASKGDWFDLCTSARKRVEMFAAMGDCLEYCLPQREIVLNC